MFGPKIKFKSFKIHKFVIKKCKNIQQNVIKIKLSLYQDIASKMTVCRCLFSSKFEMCDI